MDDPSEPILQHVRCFQDEQRGRSRPIALLTPGDLLPVAAGGPAGGFGAVIPPWLDDEMRRILGMPDYPFAVMEHPISSASADALARQAEAVLERSLALILRA